MFAHWPKSHAKRVTTDNRQNSVYPVVVVISRLRTEKSRPAENTWSNYVKNEQYIGSKKTGAQNRCRNCLVSHENNELRTTVYRKPTHTDRLLDESSYNPTSLKATTIKTLTRRAQLVCDSPESSRDENRYLERVFHKLNYNADFYIRRNIYQRTEAGATNRNLTPVTTVTIPYIQ